MSVYERVQAASSQREDTGNKGNDLGALRERLKAGLVARLGLSTIAGLLARADVEAARSELMVALEATLNAEEGVQLSAQERAELIRQVADGICGLGPIQALLDDGSVTEVIVNGCESLFFERGGELRQAPCSFESADQIMVAIDRILAPLGRRLDRSSPIVDARLANGDRVNAVAEGVAINGPLLTIRKFSSRVRSLDALVQLGSVPEWFARLLSWAVRLRRSIAVAGGTGSGKTTLLNALSCEIPVTERIVTIEDSAELRFDAHPDVARLEARPPSIEGVGEVTIRDLVKNALRMRPDRIVVGEVRGEECIDMLQAMNTGHDGSLTTLHAGSAEEAVARLVLMARFGMDLPVSLIEEQIATAIDFIVMARRLSDGSRAVTGMHEVARGVEGTVELVECVAFDQTKRLWKLVQEPAFVSQAVAEGRLSAAEVNAWRSSCSL